MRLGEVGTADVLRAKGQYRETRKHDTEVTTVKKVARAPLLLFLLMFAGLACSDLTTSTEMVFDPVSEGPATFERVQGLFDVSCASSGCHGGQEWSAWPDLRAGEAYDNIVGVESSQGIPLVAPGHGRTAATCTSSSCLTPRSPGTACPSGGRTWNRPRSKRFTCG